MKRGTQKQDHICCRFGDLSSGRRVADCYARQRFPAVKPAWVFGQEAPGSAALPRQRRGFPAGRFARQRTEGTPEKVSPLSPSRQHSISTVLVSKTDPAGLAEGECQPSVLRAARCLSAEQQLQAHVSHSNVIVAHVTRIIMKEMDRHGQNALQQPSTHPGLHGSERPLLLFSSPRPPSLNRHLCCRRRG